MHTFVSYLIDFCLYQLYRSLSLFDTSFRDHYNHHLSLSSKLETVTVDEGVFGAMNVMKDDDLRYFLKKGIFKKNWLCASNVEKSARFFQQIKAIFSNISQRVFLTFFRKNYFQSHPRIQVPFWISNVLLVNGVDVFPTHTINGAFALIPVPLAFSMPSISSL